MLITNSEQVKLIFILFYINYAKVWVDSAKFFYEILFNQMSDIKKEEIKEGLDTAPIYNMKEKEMKELYE